MEEKKQFKQFGVFEIPKDGKSEVLHKTPVSERSRGSTSVQNINTDKTYNVNIGKGVTIHLNDKLMYSINPVPNIKTLSYKEFVELDKQYPDLIEGFTPPLYKEFIVKGKLLNQVNIGDLSIINPKYRENNTMKNIVLDIYFKSLNNMTVLIAKLDNEELVLYNRLQLCK